MASYSGFSSTDIQKKSKPNSTYDCPVCMDYLLPPIYQCFNGHTLCNSCEPKVNICPVCRDNLPKERRIRNLILEEIVEGSLFDCKNYDQGCLVSLKYHEIQNHSWECQFMELPICSHLGIKCDAKHSIKTIVKHLKSVHGVLGFNFEDLPSTITVGNKSENDISIFESIPIEICQTASLSRLERSKDIVWKPHYFVFQGNLFFLLTQFDSKDKTCTWTVAFLGGSKLAKEYVAKIKLMPKESGVTALEWQGQVSEVKNEIPKPMHPIAEDELPAQIKPETLNLTLSVKKLELLCKSSNSSPPKEVKQNEDFLNWRLHIQLTQIKENEGEDENDDSKSNYGWNPKQAGVVVDSEVSYDGHVIVVNSTNGLRGKPGVWFQKDFAEKVQQQSQSQALAPASASTSGAFAPGSPSTSHRPRVNLNLTTTLNQSPRQGQSFLNSLQRQLRRRNENEMFNSFTGFYEEPSSPVPFKPGYIYFED